MYSLDNRTTDNFLSLKAAFAAFLIVFLFFIPKGIRILITDNAELMDVYDLLAEYFDVDLDSGDRIIISEEDISEAQEILNQNFVLDYEII